MKASMRGEAGGEDGHTEEGEESRAGEGYISLRGLTARLRSMGSTVHVQSRPAQLIPAPSAHRLPPDPVQPIAAIPYQVQIADGHSVHPTSGQRCLRTITAQSHPIRIRPSQPSLISAPFLPPRLSCSFGVRVPLCWPCSTAKGISGG